MPTYPERILCLTEETEPKGSRWLRNSNAAAGDRGGGTAVAIETERLLRGMDSPLISGIQWVEELVEVAGGQVVFPELRETRLAKDRIVAEEEVRRRNPDVILASWCGKKMKKSTIVSRAGWGETGAVINDRIIEIPSTYILQPFPAALTEGVRLIHERLASMYSE